MAVLLTWVNRVEGDGIRVYRDTSPIDISNLPTPIATLAADATQYMDESGGSSYYAVSSYKGVAEKLALFSDQLGAPQQPLSDVSVFVPNAGFEDGVLSPWSVVSGTFVVTTVAGTVRTGTYSAFPDFSAGGVISQYIDVSAYAERIDLGGVSATFKAWLRTDAVDTGRLILSNHDGTFAFIGSSTFGAYTSHNGFFAEKTVVKTVAPNTRYIRLRLEGLKGASGTQCNTNFDDVSLSLTE